jgi:O-antigen/teichoic acid export membrane protein
MKFKNLNNSVWSIADVLIYPALYLLFTPFFIKHLGEELYGVWMIVNTIVVFMQIFNFGLGINTQRNIAISLGKKDNTEIPVIINANLSIALLLSIICIIVGIAFAQIQFSFDFFHISKQSQQTTTLSISISGIIVGLKFIEQIFTNTLIAYERIALVSRYNIFIRLIVLMAAIALIYKGATILYIFLFTVLAYLVAIALLYIFLQQSTGLLKLKFSFSKAIFSKEFQYSKWIWLQSVFVIIAFQCDKFLIAHWVGVKSFSYYSIVSTIFNHLHLALMAVAPWAIPQITKLFAAKQSYKEYYFSMRSLIHIICYVGIAVFYLLYTKLFTLWLGADLFSEVVTYIRMYMAFQLIFVFTITPFYLLNAIGRGKLATINTFVYSALSLLGVFVGYAIYQSIEGILLGLIVSIIIAILVQQVVLSISLHLNPFWESIGLLLPMGTLSCFILMEDYSMVAKASMLVCSLVLFFYIYFVKYPVGFQSLRTATQS